ncbi:MAG: hypothetical protein H6817_08670 [Phycisphaerales bacterium]|nr:hypothetical protein [Phycisphaerales bacterium]
MANTQSTRRPALVGATCNRGRALTLSFTLLTCVALLVPSGCGKRSKIEQDKQETASGADLNERAGELWKARAAEDCATMFLFEPTRGDEGVTEEEYINYCKNEEPFRVHDYEILDTVTEGDLGWVELNVSTSMRKFPSAAPVESHRWEKWHHINGEWMPVGSKDLTAYPDAPALRDRDAEAELRKRFDASWQARLDRDWPTLYDFIDPRDRDQVDSGVFADTHALFEYLSCDVHWVEVKGNAGVVYVTVHHKLNDPSLTKLPPRDATVREEWVRHDNEWYLDVRRGE